MHPHHLAYVKGVGVAYVVVQICPFFVSNLAWPISLGKLTMLVEVVEVEYAVGTTVVQLRLHHVVQILRVTLTTKDMVGAEGYVAGATS